VHVTLKKQVLGAFDALHNRSKWNQAQHSMTTDTSTGRNKIKKVQALLQHSLVTCPRFCQTDLKCDGSVVVQIFPLLANLKMVPLFKHDKLGSVKA
jgi:hypothetical protein